MVCFQSRCVLGVGRIVGLVGRDVEGFFGLGVGSDGPLIVGV